MNARAFGLLIAASLGLAACGGTNSDEDNANIGGPATALDNSAPIESLGENGGMMNDITTANDVAIGNLGEAAGGSAGNGQ